MLSSSPFCPQAYAALKPMPPFGLCGPPMDSHTRQEDCHPRENGLLVEKRLLVNGKRMMLASDHVRLKLNEVGEAFFEVLEEPGDGGKTLIELYAGVGEGQEFLVFTGALRELKRLAQGRYRITAHELSTVLNLPIIINLQRCTARDVIAKIERETGLKFLLPKGAAYLDEFRLQFHHYGPASEAIRLLSAKWELKEMVWFQLPDGRMYWGHWAQGPYTRAPLPIESKLISNLDKKTRTLVLPYIPALRPGMLVESDFRFRIDALTFTGNTVKVTWMGI